jgi:hypothetical protein
METIKAKTDQPIVAPNKREFIFIPLNVYLARNYMVLDQDYNESFTGLPQGDRASS